MPLWDLQPSAGGCAPGCGNSKGESMKIVKLNRRDFLKSTALVTGGFLLGFELPIQAKTQHNVAQLGPFL